MLTEEVSNVLTEIVNFIKCHDENVNWSINEDFKGKKTNHTNNTNLCVLRYIDLLSEDLSINFKNGDNFKQYKLQLSLYLISKAIPY